MVCVNVTGCAEYERDSHESEQACCMTPWYGTPCLVETFRLQRHID